MAVVDLAGDPGHTGSVFLGWEVGSDCEGGSVTMTSDRSCVPHSVAVSYDPNGDPIGNVQVAPRICRDGRFVLFRTLRSFAPPLVLELFLHDRDTDDDGVFDEPDETNTILATPNSTGGALQGVEPRFDLDASGRYVAFESSDPSQAGCPTRPSSPT